MKDDAKCREWGGLWQLVSKYVSKKIYVRAAILTAEAVTEAL